MASATDREESKELKNPLIQLLLAEPTTATKPTTKPATVVRRSGKRKKVVMESESEEEEEEEEDQLYVAELDTFMPANLIELAVGDPAGNEQSIDSPVEDQGMDDYLARVVVPTEEEEMEQEEETQLIVYRRRSRRGEIGEVQPVVAHDVQEELVAPEGKEVERADEVEEVVEMEEQGGTRGMDEDADLAIILVGEEQGATAEEEVLPTVDEAGAETETEERQPTAVEEEEQQEIKISEDAPVGDEVDVAAAKVQGEGIQV